MNDSHAVLCVFLLLVCIVVCVIYTCSPADCDFKEVPYIVQQGDSLWRIATKFCPNTFNKRDYIELVMKLNGLDNSVIHPGQYLIVYQ